MSQFNLCKLRFLAAIQQKQMCTIGTEDTTVRQQGIIQYAVPQGGFFSVRINPQQHPVSGTDSRIFISGKLVLFEVFFSFDQIPLKKQLLG